MRTQRAGARVVLAVAAMFAVLGVFASGVGAQEPPEVTAPQASATVTGRPTVSGTLEDESIRVLIDNCEPGSADVFIDGIPVATVTITSDSGAEVVVAIPDGATPPYQVTVVCDNGTADTLVTVPVVQVPDEDDATPQEEGGAGAGGGNLPLTGGGGTLVPLARGAAVVAAIGALMVLATRRRNPAAV